MKKAQAAKDAAAIDEIQNRLYAEGQRTLLVILQGTDTSGKDGTIRNVFSATGPLGVSVTAFRSPNEEERAHDYLRRVHLACPRRGTIGIFNRSHYEGVLIARVKRLAPAKGIEARYDQWWCVCRSRPDARSRAPRVMVSPSGSATSAPITASALALEQAALRRRDPAPSQREVRVVPTTG